MTSIRILREESVFPVEIGDSGTYCYQEDYLRLSEEYGSHGRAEQDMCRKVHGVSVLIC